MIKEIAEGHFNELVGNNEELSEKRMEICRKCPLFKNTVLGPVCNKNLWINPKTNEVSENYKLGYIKGCGCRLLAKTTIPYVECDAGKW